MVEEFEYELDLWGTEALVRRARHDLVISSTLGGWGTDFGGRVWFYTRENRGVYATHRACTVTACWSTGLRKGACRVKESGCLQVRFFFPIQQHVGGGTKTPAISRVERFRYTAFGKVQGGGRACVQHELELRVDCCRETTPGPSLLSAHRYLVYVPNGSL